MLCARGYMDCCTRGKGGVTTGDLILGDRPDFGPKDVFYRPLNSGMRQLHDKR